MSNYQQGNLSAFEHLYIRYKDASYRYFLRQCQQQQLAEDLHQELWTKVIKHNASYQEKAQFKLWLYTIAHNIVIDHWRKPCAINQDDPDHITSNTQPDSDLEQQRLTTRLSYCLKKLPSLQLETFLLNQESGLTAQQIAQVISASQEATKSRLRYAFKALRQCLSLIYKE